MCSYKCTYLGVDFTETPQCQQMSDDICVTSERFGSRGVVSQICRVGSHHCVLLLSLQKESSDEPMLCWNRTSLYSVSLHFWTAAKCCL